MAKTLTYKILERHLVTGELVPGKEIGIRIDQTLTQDATGTMAYLQLEAMGIDRVKTELSVSYVDHNTLQVGFENADDHRYLQTVAARYGIYFSRPGNGICHQVHLERFGAPAKTLLGSDSHTPTGGGIGMIAIGAGGLDVAVAMGGGAFYLTAPKVIGIELTGRLRPWVSAKDVILFLLSKISTKGNVNKVLEYYGPGVATLTVPQRATITNMGAETGVTTSLFPSDETTRAFLKAQKREGAWTALAADPGARYDEVMTIDLTKVEPMVAVPHSPGNVVAVREVAGKKVDQVEIGSCTNSSLRDNMIVAALLKGATVHPGVSLAIAPGSRQVFSMIAHNGALAAMIDAGARIMESACGFCIGNGQSPNTDGVSVRTSNRNFEGRSGTASGQIFLASPEVAALAALSGVFVDPLAEKIPYPVVTEPELFAIDDGMIIAPVAETAAVAICRGPNIGNPPVSAPLVDALTGAVALKVGDKITTDHIMPAGQRLKYRSNIKKYAEFVFEGVDKDFSKRAAALRDDGTAVFIVAGDSYGQGSSREHAAICPMYLGVRAVIAKSFERIHAANLVNFGILPLVFAHPADYDRVSPGDTLAIRDLLSQLEAGTVTVADLTQKSTFTCSAALTARQKAIIRAGGLLNHTRG